jgi:hypothetical protein
MTDYYCTVCWKNNGYLSPVLPVSGHMTNYQSGKIQKHMTPVRVYPKNSMFVLSDLGEYYTLLTDAVNSGCLEVDRSGRKSLVFSPGGRIGILDQSGVGSAPCTSVSVVCPEYSGFIHGYPGTVTSGSRVCSACGRPVQ